jgi:hypothetical protein
MFTGRGGPVTKALRDGREELPLMRNALDHRLENLGQAKKESDAGVWDQSADHIRAGGQIAAFKGR